MYNIAIFPASSQVSLEILNALINHKEIKNIIGINSHDNYEFKNLYSKTYDDSPLYDNENCINYILNICSKEKIDFIFPSMDSSHLILSKQIELFNKNNILVLTSDYSTNEICFSKENTYNCFNGILDLPVLYSITDNIEFPVFLKPKIGYGSKNYHIIKNYTELNNLYNENMLILEFLPNDEYTIDCFTHNNKLIYFNPRIRRLYKNGLSIITENILFENDIYFKIKNIANLINNKLNFSGSWFFQVKLDKNFKFKLLEISTRVAGASAINRLVGVNLPLLSIYNKLKNPIELKLNQKKFINHKIISNKLNLDFMNKIENIYFDFDDTILINNHINYQAMSFIYKFQNKNIFLITKHNKNIYESLKQYKIDSNLFKEIYHLNKNENKNDYIKDNSLFFDDSFKERNSINKNCICLDIDSLEFFI